MRQLCTAATEPQQVCEFAWVPGIQVGACSKPGNQTSEVLVHEAWDICPSGPGHTVSLDIIYSVHVSIRRLSRSVSLQHDCGAGVPARDEVRNPEPDVGRDVGSGETRPRKCRFRNPGGLGTALR